MIKNSMLPVNGLTSLLAFAALAHGAFTAEGSTKGVATGEAQSRVAEMRKLMVDPQATPETVALFYNLKQIAKRGQTY